MADNICYLLLILLSVYIGIYTVYYAFSVYFASKGRRMITKHKFYNPPYENNIIMVIYCENNQGDVVSLLEMMNKQDYPKTNYQTHIILDNCSDDISNKLEFIGGAKIWRLGVAMAAVAVVMLLVIVNMDALFAPSYYEQYVEQLSDAPMEVLYDCVIDYVEYADDTTIL